jgi:hypothetical protein
MKLPIALLLASLTFTAELGAQSPSPTVSAEPKTTDQSSPAKNPSPDKKWEYDCPESIQYECSPEVVKTDTGDRAVDLDGDLNVYGKYSKRSNLVWAPDSKRFAFNFPQPASHAFYETIAFYQLRGDKWTMLQSLASDNSISTTISKAIDSALAVERRQKHLKAKETGAIDIVTKVHEWIDPDTTSIYAYQEDGEASGQTVRADFLFTVKFDQAGKLKIVKTQKLSEEESKKYQEDSQH